MYGDICAIIWIAGDYVALNVIVILIILGVNVTPNIVAVLSIAGWITSMINSNKILIK